MITFIRRKKLAMSTARGVASYLTGDEPQAISNVLYEGDGVAIIRNDRLDTPRAKDILSRTTMLVRLGCTSGTGVAEALQLNTSGGIHAVANKMKSRMLMQAEGVSVPKSFNCWNTPADLDGHYPMVVRPRYHAQGKNLTVAHNYQDILNAGYEEWYASTYIPKVAEYRVYVMAGRVVTVAQKTPDDPSAVAWNVCQGGRFDVLPWGQWDLGVCREAIKAMSLFDGLQWGGVDVMVDEHGVAYVIEVNSAPSLPFLSDGSVSYRQSCFAKALLHSAQCGFDDIGTSASDGWRNLIHPAISKECLL